MEDKGDESREALQQQVLLLQEELEKTKTNCKEQMAKQVAFFGKMQLKNKKSGKAEAQVHKKNAVIIAFKSTFVSNMPLQAEQEELTSNLQKQQDQLREIIKNETKEKQQALAEVSRLTNELHAASQENDESEAKIAVLKEVCVSS